MKFQRTCLLTVLYSLSTPFLAPPFARAAEVSPDGYIVELRDPPVLDAFPEGPGDGAMSLADQHLFAVEKAQYATELAQKQRSITQELAASLSMTGDDLERKITHRFLYTLNGFAAKVTAEEAEQLRSAPHVERVTPNRRVKALLDQATTLVGATNVWSLNSAEQSCNSTGCIRGKGIRIGILDTGVDLNHPDFPAGKIVDGFNFVNNTPNAMDDQGHGTHCASIAAANGAVKGMAPDAQIVPYKVLDRNGSGTFSAIIAAVDRSYDPDGNKNTSDKLDIISLSLGGPGDPDDPISRAIDRAVQNGVIAVVAAGNSGPGGDSDCRSPSVSNGERQSICSPGTSRLGITVGASTKSDGIASFSSRGPVIFGSETLMKPDIVAPGASICAARLTGANIGSTCKDNRHVSLSGTSMATPAVAGIIALLKQKEPSLTHAQIKDIVLRRTTKDLGQIAELQGQGRIDALAAFLAATRTNDPYIERVGVVDSATFRERLAPGSLASIFGASLSGTGQTCTASSFPLPTELCGTRVVLNGTNAPLLYVSSTQINFQVPVETASAVGNSSAALPISVSTSRATSNQRTATIGRHAPAPFSTRENGQKFVAAHHGDLKRISLASPARPGETIVLWLTGLGQSNPAVQTGRAAPGSPLARTDVPTVKIGGRTAQVAFAGKAPGFAGLDQLNVTIPLDARTGTVEISYSDASAVAGNLPFAGTSSATLGASLLRSSSVGLRNRCSRITSKNVSVTFTAIRFRKGAPKAKTLTAFSADGRAFCSFDRSKRKSTYVRSEKCGDPRPGNEPLFVHVSSKQCVMVPNDTDAVSPIAFPK